MKAEEQNDIDAPCPFSAAASPAQSPETSFAASVVPRSSNLQFAPQCCAKCGRKTGLLGIKCRCGQNFCSTHKYAETHQCEFDYQKAAKEALMKANPQVTAQKVSQF